MLLTQQPRALRTVRAAEIHLPRGDLVPTRAGTSRLVAHLNTQRLLAELRPLLVCEAKEVSAGADNLRFLGHRRTRKEGETAARLAAARTARLCIGVSSANLLRPLRLHTAKYKL